MKKYFDSIRKYFQNELAQSAKNYLKIGLELYHFHSRRGIGIQVPIGNLGIATELMLKTYIAKNNPLLLFRSLPNELSVFFSCSGMSPKNFNWRRYDIDLRSFAFKTIELDECISTFYIFFPNYKQLLQPYFRLLSNCRNVSLHASIPSFQIYDLERTAYLALNVHEILKKENAFGYHAYFPTEKDKEFISSFDVERADRVRKKIEEAKKKSKKLTRAEVLVSVDGWDFYTTSCPICDSEGVLTGFTDFWVEGPDEEHLDYGLNFFADSFECSECGLILEDVEELNLAGMAVEYDRSSDLEEWFEEQEPDISEF